MLRAASALTLVMPLVRNRPPAVMLLRGASADEVANDHQPRCDANTRLQGRVGLQVTDSSDQLQPCARTACSASSSCAWGYPK
jgi:hypothetical protein